MSAFQNKMKSQLDSKTKKKTTVTKRRFDSVQPQAKLNRKDKQQISASLLDDLIDSQIASPVR
jgi:hypothetical protein